MRSTRPRVGLASPQYRPRTSFDYALTVEIGLVIPDPAASITGSAGEAVDAWWIPKSIGGSPGREVQLLAFSHRVRAGGHERSVGW